MAEEKAPTILPEEIWREIAKHVSLKEWVRVASTCKPLWHFQLDMVRITPAEGIKPEQVLPAVRFAARRWGNAVAVSLCDAGEEAANMQIAGEIVRHSENLHKVMDLSLQWAGSSQLLAMMLARLTAGADHLERMFLTGVRKLPCLLYFQNLQLLRLECEAEEAGAISSAVKASPALQVLCIESGQITQRPLAPDLDLRSCPKLHTLHLDHCVPTSLQLAAECKVIVDVWDLQSARSESLKACAKHAHDFSIHLGRNSFAEARTVLEEIQPACTVLLDLQKIGERQSPVLLDGVLATVENLWLLTERDMHIKIPAEFSWQHLTLEAKGALSIEYVDMVSFMQHMPVFKVKCDAMHRLSAFVDFVSCMRGSGHTLLATYASETDPEDTACGFEVESAARAPHVQLWNPFRRSCCGMVKELNRAVV